MCNYRFWMYYASRMRAKMTMWPFLSLSPAVQIYFCSWTNSMFNAFYWSEHRISGCPMSWQTIAFSWSEMLWPNWIVVTMEGKMRFIFKMFHLAIWQVIPQHYWIRSCRCRSFLRLRPLLSQEYGQSMTNISRRPPSWAALCHGQAPYILLGKQSFTLLSLVFELSLWETEIILTFVCPHLWFLIQLGFLRLLNSFFGLGS